MVIEQNIPKTKIKEAEAPKEWDMIIEPRVSLLDLNLKEVWRYRDLIWLFVRRDFVAQYKQTILGPLWHFIQPVLTTIMFLLVFGKIARIPTDGIAPTVFYMSGITLWNYFSLSLTSTSNTFISNASIFGKVYFPRLVLPISIVISNLVKFGIQFLLLTGVIIYFNFHGYPFHFSFNLLIIPFLLIQMAALGLGLGIIISSITTKYRDFNVLLTFAVQLAMYATPVAYPLSFLRNKGYKWIIDANPLTPVFEAFRFALFGKGTVEMHSVIYSLIFTIVALAVGVILFNKVEKSFMDTV